jgi:DNA-binding FadR family transcriptional regulator
MGPGLAEADGALDIFELRLIVEVAAAERAALRRTPEQLEGHGVGPGAHGYGPDRGEDGATADDDFHCAIAAASGNP